MKKISTLLSIMLICGVANAQTRIADSTALATFYNNTAGGSWTNKTNWLVAAQPMDNWYGITLSGGRVQSIVLSNNNIAGNISNSASQIITSSPMM